MDVYLREKITNKSLKRHDETVLLQFCSVIDSAHTRVDATFDLSCVNSLNDEPSFYWDLGERWLPRNRGKEAQPQRSAIIRCCSCAGETSAGHRSPRRSSIKSLMNGASLIGGRWTAQEQGNGILEIPRTLGHKKHSGKKVPYTVNSSANHLYSCSSKYTFPLSLPQIDANI